MEQQDYSKEEKEKILQNFEEKFNNAQVNLESEFSEIVCENFWDLIEYKYNND